MPTRARTAAVRTARVWPDRCRLILRAAGIGARGVGLFGRCRSRTKVKSTRFSRSPLDGASGKVSLTSARVRPRIMRSDAGRAPHRAFYRCAPVFRRRRKNARPRATASLAARPARHAGRARALSSVGRSWRSARANSSGPMGGRSSLNVRFSSCRFPVPRGTRPVAISAPEAT
jgi:hypothetical protein